MSQAPKFYYAEMSADVWERVVCRVKHAHIFLNTSEFDGINKGDIFIISDVNNPSAKCVCKVTSVQTYPGFKSAFFNSNVTALGYYGAEKKYATFHDFGDDYSLNEVRKYGVVAIFWQFLSCEFIPDSSSIGSDLQSNSAARCDPEYKYLKYMRISRAKKSATAQTDPVDQEWLEPVEEGVPSEGGTVDVSTEIESSQLDKPPVQDVFPASEDASDAREESTTDCV